MDRESDFYAPWAASGYDETTTQRLRIKKDVLHTIFSTNEESVFFNKKDIEDDEIRELQPYFSSREFSLLGNMLLYRFCSGNGSGAVLLITDSPYFMLDSSVINIILSTVSEMVKAKLEEACRIRYTQLSKPVEMLNESAIIEQTETFLSGIEAEDAAVPVLLCINSDNIIQETGDAYPDIDRFRLQTDILTILYTLCTEIGPISPAGENNILILLNKKQGLDASIIHHQLSITIRQHFCPDKPDFGLACRIIRYPNDGTTGNELYRAALSE